MALKLSITAPGATPQEITLDQPRVKVGRGPTVDVRLPSRAVSELHAVFHVDGSEVAVVDEGSTNGTRVNGALLPPGRRKLVRDGDVVCLAEFALTVSGSLAAPDPPERTASIARRLLLDSIRDAGGEAAPPHLALVNTREAGRFWPLAPAASLVIGRGEDCDIVLDDRDCSRRHAEVSRDGEGALLRDLGSRNGVVVQGRASTERRLRHGDELTFGRTVLRYVDPTEDLLRALDRGEDHRAPTPAPPEPAPAVSSEPEPGDAEEETRSSPRVSLTPRASAPAERRSRPSQVTPPGRADWLVVLLAAVILLVSLVSLAIVLRPG
ncbi:MAG: FHA domain-containing protein [Polyangiales bacterium]